MIIDCDTCTAGPTACGDCVVSFFTVPVRPGMAPRVAAAAPPTLDAVEQAAVEALMGAGLVPPLRRQATG